ncbi:Catalase [Labilithrix luteola]|uniref:Catalase n=1 Tax=Labilithrix luteola TaxID=1391654 RepID=A0A0K1Q787_9BACT|nr:hypothetical protein [Labilithrix luteola]AKV01589.1 Catalase [Labilithrix luteola]
MSDNHSETKSARTTKRSMFARKPRLALLGMVGLLSAMAACGASEDDDSASLDSALADMNEGNFWDKLTTQLARFGDGLTGPSSWTAPDQANRWTMHFTPTRVGQENGLLGDADLFQKLAADIQRIQETLEKKNSGAFARAFHAKPHACVKGQFFVHVPDDIVTRTKLPADTSIDSLKVGLFRDSASPYDVWVRWSNGVGGKNRPDGEVDVRGLALKVLGVEGPRLPDGPRYFHQQEGTQDILMTNGATTPAPNSETFAAFGLAQAKMAGAEGPFEKLGALKNFFKYLVANPRVGSTLVYAVLPNTKHHDSVLEQTFFTGGALALGIDDLGHARQAMKISAQGGIWKPAASGIPGQGTCESVASHDQNPADFALPGGDPVGGSGNPDYLSTGVRGVKSTLAKSPLCIDVRVQFQRHDAAMLAAQTQPIEDTSVEWRTADSPFVSVGTIIIDRRDDPSAEEAECNELSWNPWHGLVEHRPLGNIMRVRQEVLAASAQKRGARQ